MYICLKCTKFLKINAGNSLSVRKHISNKQRSEMFSSLLKPFNLDQTK